MSWMVQTSYKEDLFCIKLLLLVPELVYFVDLEDMHINKNKSYDILPVLARKSD